MDVYNESLELHLKHKGKLRVESKVPAENAHDLSLAYTPGVAQPCLEIQKDKENAYLYTGKGNTVAVVTDGTAVLGLGDIGPEAAMPVMEGKCLLMRRFGGLDAWPVCLDTKDTDEIVETVVRIAPGFGAVNLEDIAAPRCFEIEAKLKERLNIPVFHDDQHGTAIVVLAALINALKLSGRNIGDIRVVISGAGSAGAAIGNLIMAYGVRHLLYCDRKGIVSRDTATTEAKKKLCETSNEDNINGTLADALKGADVFIGVSAPGIVTQDMIRSMNRDPIVLAMANPTPEIMPDLALEAGAAIVGTGRSDYPNQVNNLLAFPGVFRGALDAGATDINENMKLAAAEAIAGLIREEELRPDYVIVSVFDERVVPAVSAAVAAAAVKDGICRR